MAAASTSDLDAVERYEFAQFVLENTGEEFPSMAEMEGSETFAETLSSVQDRINELQGRHTSELQRLFEHHAKQYHDEALDRYMEYEDTSVDVDKGMTTTMETLYGASQIKGSWFARRIEAETSLLRLTQVQALQPLFKLRAELELKDEDTRRRRDAAFPSSVHEYNAISSRDIQLRISRFLTADAMTQERMMSEFGWAYRQVQHLMEAYATDMRFRDEMQTRVRDVAVTDPRRKPAGISLG